MKNYRRHVSLKQQQQALLFADYALHEAALALISQQNLHHLQSNSREIQKET
jgi:hypothetical protein